MATPLPVLASTYALWHFDEAAGTGIADAGPHSINLAKNAISGSNEAIVPSFLTRARRFAGLGVYDPAGIAGPGSAGDLAMWQGEWTVEALFTPNGAPAPDPGYGGLLAYATAFTTPATNNGQALILVKRSGGINSISVGWYNGIGNLIITDSTLTVADGVRAFIAVVKRIVAGNATLDFYKDGTLAQSIAGIAQPTGGLNAGWLIGCTGDSSQPNLFGDLD